MSIQRLKIIFLFAYLFGALTSFGTEFSKGFCDVEIPEAFLTIDEGVHEDACIVSADHDHPPFSNSPFSDQLGMELEPDEEEVGKKHFFQLGTLGKEYTLYFTKAPPIHQPELSFALVHHSKIYILFEVFRL